MNFCNMLSRYVGDVQQLQQQVADHALALTRMESNLKLEMETVVSAMSDGLQQQAELRARASEDTLADIQTVWERCKDALAKTEAEVSHSSDYLQSMLRAQIQELEKELGKLDKKAIRSRFWQGQGRAVQ